MPKTIAALAISATLASAAATAQPSLPSWQFVQTIDGFEQAIDSNSVTRAPNGDVEFWERTIFPVEKRLSTVASTTEHVVAGCDHPTQMVRNGLITYDAAGNMRHVETEVVTLQLAEGANARRAIIAACRIR